MASTSIKITSHYSSTVDIKLYWCLPIFPVGRQMIAPGQTAEFPCEWVWYDVQLNPDNGVGGFIIQRGVYGGSSINIGP